MRNRNRRIGPALLASAWLVVLGGGCALATRALAGPAPAAAPAPAAQPDEDQNPHLWEHHATSVAVFKNGLGFFLREGEVDLRDGWCLTREVPPAAFGTLAVYSHALDEAVDIVGSGPGEIVEFDGTDAPKDAQTKRARLEACRHLRVELRYTQKGAERTGAGRLVSVGPDFAVLDNDSNSLAVPIEGIRRMQVLDLPVRVHVSADPGRKPPGRTKLGMAYLRKGITWIPEYTLRVLDEETAELTLRGTLVNEAEDLVHCDVNFVVGVPHFVHTEYLAPVAVGQIIRTIGAAVAPAQIQTQIMNRAAIATHQARDEFDGAAAVVERPPAAGGDLKAALGNLPQFEAAAANDYTVFTKKDLTVRRGEKAIVTLFTRKITYAHRYRWTIPGDMVHLLALRNDTGVAWTTGSCLAASAGAPLGEDLLRYTPRGSMGEIPVTTAINLAHSQSEKEVDRKLKAHEPATNFFLDLVTVDGELTVRNYEKRAVEVSITTAVPGKPLAVSEGGTMWVDTAKLQLLERSGSVSWSVRLEPGETKTFTYRYERYVPSK
jgi:hypothetical protein